MNAFSWMKDGGNRVMERRGLLSTPTQQGHGFTGFFPKSQGSQGAQLYQNYVNSLLQKYGAQYGAQPQQQVFGLSQPEPPKPISWRETQHDYGGGSA